jgi:redox-sensitive bicupin YhaK (pirin superfamily)
MSGVRPIREVSRSNPTIEGAGVHLKRAFGFHQVPWFDPFLLLDDFHSSVPSEYLPGFPWHPHRGIETLTYVLHGRIVHGDSMGNSGTIGEGDVQWMTAGSGIIHQEMPGGDAEGLLRGFQIWANLPASHKMMEPRGAPHSVRRAQERDFHQNMSRGMVWSGSLSLEGHQGYSRQR